MGYPISVTAGDGQGDSNFMTQLDPPSPPSLESPSLAESSSLHRRGFVDVTIGSVNLFMSLPSPKSSTPKFTEVKATDLDSQETDMQNTGPSQALSPIPDSGSESGSQVVSLQGTSTSNALAPVQTHYCQELNASIEISSLQTGSITSPSIA
ncbi:hypothetical protein Clacol_008495 [Clathrus columnatus]|uniref:Uncharacterized protein n=1 Tax=Clathrus columnatus TaxID=1419009 RepID=A0AAV5AKP1_9AGAM|nr:hypothetical protein Clacol_008495 [Clathrus columnatus]